MIDISWLVSYNGPGFVDRRREKSHETLRDPLPGGGGQIYGTVYLVLPQGQNLPVHMAMNVPVGHTLPVQMDVSVAIPLRETELGPVVDQLRGLLLPYMDILDEVLKCSEE